MTIERDAAIFVALTGARNLTEADAAAKAIADAIVPLAEKKHPLFRMRSPFYAPANHDPGDEDRR